MCTRESDASVSWDPELWFECAPMRVCYVHARVAEETFRTERGVEVRPYVRGGYVVPSLTSQIRLEPDVYRECEVNMCDMRAMWAEEFPYFAGDPSFVCDVHKS